MSVVEPHSNSEARPVKTHELIARQLRDRILSGELTAGQRLPPEDELTEQFGIARTTLREALRVLESQGLLTIRRGRGGGPEITHPDLRPAATALAISLRLEGTSLRDLAEAREMIEPSLAAKLAVEHTEDDLAVLEAAVAVAHEAAEANDVVAFGAAADGVHEALIERSGNRTLATMAQLMHDMVRAYYAQAAVRADQKTMRRAVRSYRRFIEILRAGDADGASAHWTAQLQYTSRTADVDRPIPQPAD